MVLFITFKNMSEISRQLPSTDIAQSPFRDLWQLASPPGSETGRLKELGSRAQELIETFKRNSIIIKTPGSAEEQLANLESLRAETWRYEQRTFFVTQRGDMVYGGETLEKMLGNSYVPLASGFDSDTYSSLAEKHAVLAALHKLHFKSLERILLLSDGDFLIESGAGANINRINFFDAIASKNGAAFALHDLVPASPQFCLGNISPTIPYYVMPDGVEYFGELLKAAPGRTKTVMLNDVISSISLTDISSLIRSCDFGHVDRILITQTLGLARTSNILPPQYEIGGIDFKEMTINNWINFCAQNGYTEHLVRENLPLFALQAEHTASNCFFEIALQHLVRQAAAKKYLAQVYLSTKEVCFEGSAGRAIAAQIHPGYLNLIEQCAVNHISFSPFQQQFSNDPSVPDGKIKISATQLHIVLARRNVKNGQTGEMTRLPPRSFIVPKNCLAVQRAFVDLMSNSVTPDSLNKRFADKSFIWGGALFGYNFALGIVRNSKNYISKEIWKSVTNPEEYKKHFIDPLESVRVTF
jgi:hypothetical protein